MEVAVLKRLQGVPYVCDFIGCGRTEKVNYVVMSLLGSNLSELRKRQPQQKLTTSTILRLSVQIIAAVQAVHNCGFLHRDIKPSNFAMGGYPETSRRCYILDFGLARQYITPTGELRQPRSIAGFRGTVRYASVNAHLGHDLGRHDDLWSVFYMISELCTGQLPWRRIRNREDVGECKLSYDHGKLISCLPIEFKRFHSHLKTLTYFSNPDYSYIIRLFEQAMERLSIHQTDPFDWEQDNGVPSGTSASVMSPPVNSQAQQLQGNIKEGPPSSKTRCSETDLYPDNNCLVKKIIVTVESREANGDSPHIVHPVEELVRGEPAFNNEDTRDVHHSEEERNTPDLPNHHRLCVGKEEAEEDNDKSHSDAHSCLVRLNLNEPCSDSRVQQQQQQLELEQRHGGRGDGTQEQHSKQAQRDHHYYQRECHQQTSSETNDGRSSQECPGQQESAVNIHTSTHIPHLPTQPPPPGYFCSSARRRRYRIHLPMTKT